MTIEEQNALLAKEYSEAIRYMDNAKACLQKAKKDGPVYVDRKYVRMACGTAYNGVLIAVEAWLRAKGVELPENELNAATGKKVRMGPKPRKSINLYYRHIAQLDGKLSAMLHSVYGVLHLDGYYDGITSVKVITAGIEEAYDIIDKIKPGAYGG